MDGILGNVDLQGAASKLWSTVIGLSKTNQPKLQDTHPLSLTMNPYTTHKKSAANSTNSSLRTPTTAKKRNEGSYT